MEYVSRRPNLGPQEWIEYVSVSRISPEIARFVFDFFDTRGVPVGKVRVDDGLEADLHLTKSLPLERGDEFQEDFMGRFGVSRLFRPGPAPDTVGDLLTFVQGELDDWREHRSSRLCS